MAQASNSDKSRLDIKCIDQGFYEGRDGYLIFTVAYRVLGIEYSITVDANDLHESDEEDFDIEHLLDVFDEHIMVTRCSPHFAWYGYAMKINLSVVEHQTSIRKRKREPVSYFIKDALQAYIIQKKDTPSPESLWQFILELQSSYRLDAWVVEASEDSKAITYQRRVNNPTDTKQYSLSKASYRRHYHRYIGLRSWHEESTKEMKKYMQ